MRQKRISQKELKCIVNHLSYSIKAIMRDSKSLTSLFIENYDFNSMQLVTLLINAFQLADNLYEKSKD